MRLDQLVEAVQQRLRATDRKCGNQQRAALRQGPVHDALKFVEWIAGWMQPVPIGGFHQ